MKTDNNTSLSLTAIVKVSEQIHQNAKKNFVNSLQQKSKA